ncbi:MAG: outer membrane protein insertion porin family [Thiomicrorhabdus sp.]|nr:MAG: outer membrane protein insertion porin family [Thiomicrorhabdus sp.]
MVNMTLNKITKFSLSRAVAFLMLAPSLACAFTVENIELEGASRIEFETIDQYLTIAKGKYLDTATSQETIKNLYKTGFFKDVALYKKGDATLVIRVVERPSISEVIIEGNELIETDVLNNALDSLGIKKGRIYNKVELDRVVIDLKRRYQNQGYYAAEVEIESKSLPRNRVELNIKIIEGQPAAIGRVTLIGNKVYTDQRLKMQMKLIEGEDYSKPVLQADIEVLKSYYLDRGYAKFNVRSSQVSLSTDKTRVFATVNIEEGAQYTFSDVNFIGELILEEKELASLAVLKPKDTFSRSKVIEAVNAIRDRLSEDGYAFAEIEPKTALNDEDKTIALSFNIQPGSRIYIRRVAIEGNTRTRDHVIRREMRQLESAPYSLALVRQSQMRLDRLGFFKSSEIQTKRVSADQVDLVINVVEQATGSFNAGIGFSQLDGMSFNVGVSERNFIGSGNKLDFNIATSASKKTADIGLTNPYFTDDGVSLGAGFYLSEIDAEKLDIADFTTNNFGIRTSLGYPLSENDSLNYGLKFNSQDLVCSSVFTSCLDHVSEFGAVSRSVVFSMGWNHNSTNSFYFPSEGHKTRLSFETVVPSTSDISYYKVYANETMYQPITKNISLKLKANMSYGAGYSTVKELPFYQRFYAGGIGSVRGFEPNSLGGNYDLIFDGSDRPRGGVVKLVSSAAFVLPIPFIEDSSNIRMSVFFDAGNVFSSVNAVDTAMLRTSVGIGISWITPVGPLTFSLAEPVGYDSIDKLQKFQFSLGSQF